VTAVTQMNLRTVRSPERAVDLLRLLGYESRALPYDLRALGLDGASALRLNSDRSPSRGYGVLVAELDGAPRSLRSFGRRLVEQFHDRPLAFVGVRNGGGEWRELLVLRPRLIEGGGGAVALRKLTIDVERPTSHDAEVVRGLRWDPADEQGSQTRIDSALDVERVTRRFFEGLSEHHERLLEAVRMAGSVDSAVLAGLERAGGSERVALRIITQILFCYFVQRKGLLEGERGWLTLAFQRNLASGSYYQRVLEPLFYDALSTPLDERSEEWRREGIPFLNGGLFERHYGDVSLPLPDDLFSTDEGLLGFLDRWTFTVAEEAANESEVAVDPEMLGRVFENLISDDEMRREGTVYTPRPVVQFMCREALVPYLVRKAEIEENQAREVLVDDEAIDHVAERAGAPAALALARRVDRAVEDLRAIDPAVGSGAFLLGLMTELIRLRRLGHLAIEGGEPGPELVREWRMHLIERSLFGVDVNPTAIELCRLRLWLSLIVDEGSGTPHPLPNLEYRTVSGDSLTDFVGGVEVQQTRSGDWTLGLDVADPTELVALRERYFEASDPGEKRRLRAELEGVEEAVVETIFERVDARARQPRRNRRAQEEARATLESVPGLRARFSSRDRVFPAFLPSFSAPDVVQAGGWDVVIMNPPYVGRKALRERFDAGYLADLERHYGRTYDLMIHFGKRAFEFAHPEHGVVAMIFNDSIFTSTDADDFRRQLFDPDARTLVVAAARTRCFEGTAVNGGVIVATRDRDPDEALRWSENHGRPPADLAGASMPAEEADSPYTVGRSELWVVPRSEYRRLPHRPLFRPSGEARTLLGVFEGCAAWDELSHWDRESGGDWPMLSETARLEEWKRSKRNAGFYERFPGRDRFVLLGLVTVGGQGLATADDKRFLAAVEGTEEADEALERRERLAQLVLERDRPARLYTERLEQGRGVEEALLDVALEFKDAELGWPRQGLIRTAPAERVLNRRLSREEVAEGIVGEAMWVPFEKGDRSDAEGGARWRRENPIVIDWSRSKVALLRQRARQQSSYRRPRIQNEEYWGEGGIAWNAVGSYLRARLVPAGAVFGHGSPVIRPSEDWLPIRALLALLNAPVLDFALRTYLCSRMNIHVGDLRRLPVPVLRSAEAERLTDLGRSAIAAKEALDLGGRGNELPQIEAELDGVVRQLYGIRRDADLWVVR
jgi:Eco57I restriction-modification methylase